MTTTGTEQSTLENAARPHLPPSRILGYAAGDAGCNIAFQMTGLFLLVFYTDVVGINPMHAGNIFLFVKIWDAFADLFAGRMVDRTMTRWGKFRPFLLWFSVPLLASNLLCFWIPVDGYGAKLAWADDLLRAAGPALLAGQHPVRFPGRRDEPEPDRPLPARLGAHGRLRNDDPAARRRPRPADQGLRQPRPDLPRDRDRVPRHRHHPVLHHLRHRAGDRHPRRRAGVAQADAPDGDQERAAGPALRLVAVLPHRAEHHLRAGHLHRQRHPQPVRRRELAGLGSHHHHHRRGHLRRAVRPDSSPACSARSAAS